LGQGYDLRLGEATLQQAQPERLRAHGDQAEAGEERGGHLAREVEAALAVEEVVGDKAPG